jgi:hypothetical protein
MAAADAITAEPGDDQLRGYFLAHPDRYEQEGVMTVRDYVFPTVSDAVGARAALMSGGSPADVLVRFHGLDSGKESGDDFYFAARIHLGDQLFALAAALPNGAVSAPSPQADGVHLLQMIANAPPKPFVFEDARPQVLNDYRTDRIQRVTAQYQVFLRKRSNVLVARDLHE